MPIDKNEHKRSAGQKFDQRQKKSTLRRNASIDEYERARSNGRGGQRQRRNLFHFSFCFPFLFLVWMKWCCTDNRHGILSDSFSSFRFMEFEWNDRLHQMQWNASHTKRKTHHPENGSQSVFIAVFFLFISLLPRGSWLSYVRTGVFDVAVHSNTHKLRCPGSCMQKRPHTWSWPASSPCSSCIFAHTLERQFTVGPSPMLLGRWSVVNRVIHP